MLKWWHTAPRSTGPVASRTSTWPAAAATWVAISPKLPPSELLLMTKPEDPQSCRICEISWPCVSSWSPSKWFRTLELKKNHQNPKSEGFAPRPCRVLQPLESQARRQCGRVVAGNAWNPLWLISERWRSCRDPVALWPSNTAALKMKKYRAIAKFRSRGGGHCWCGSRFHLNPKPCIMHRQRKKTFPMVKLLLRSNHPILSMGRFDLQCK